MRFMQLLQYPDPGLGQRRIGPASRSGQRYRELGARRAGHRIEHDDAVGQVKRLVDVMRDQYDAQAMLARHGQ